LSSNRRRAKNFSRGYAKLNAPMWMTTMQEEIEALYRNHTWELVAIPTDQKAIGNKWVYKIKRDSNDQVQ